MLSNNRTTLYLKCKDYLVSGEVFDLLYDAELDMLLTHPKPSEEELGKYYESEDYISHTDNRRTFLDKLYQYVKGINLSGKIRLINTSTRTTGNLLDIGCGTGDFLAFANKKGWSTIGTEPNKKARNIAKKKGLEIIEDTKSLASGQYDVITMWHVLEHVPDLEDYMRELYRLLSEKGVLVIAVPNFKSFDANYYKQFWAAYDVPRHLWHFSKNSIISLFGKNNFKLFKIKPLLFDSFYIALLSEKHKTAKMNYMKAFFVGFYSNLKAVITKEYSSQIYVLQKVTKTN